MYAGLTEEESGFIEKKNTEHPEKRLCERFALYDGLPADLRLIQGSRDLPKIKNEKWVEVGAPEKLIETVLDHHLSAERLIELMSIHNKIPEDTDPKRAMDLVVHHDAYKVLATDIRPADNITVEDRSRLRALSARILFAGAQDIYSRWLEFDAGVTNDARLARDGGRLQMVSRAGFIADTCPGLAPALRPYWDSAARNLHTDEAKKLFAEFEAVRDGMLAPADSPVYLEMHRGYAMAAGL